jgi:hypothetical protein
MFDESRKRSELWRGLHEANIDSDTILSVTAVGCKNDEV